MTPQVNQIEKVVVVALACMVGPLMIALTGVTGVFEDDYICRTGQVFVDCENPDTCTGACHKIVADVSTKGCTAHPGAVCQKIEVQYGVGATDYSGGTCTQATYPTYDCGCSIPPNSTGDRINQVFTCS